MNQPASSIRRACFCRSCGYDLTVSPPGPCPECATPFDPADPKTFFRSSRAKRIRTWRRRAAWGSAALLLFILFCPRGLVTTKLVWTIGPATSMSGATTTWTVTRLHLIPPAWLGPSGVGLPRYPWWTIVEGTPTSTTNTPASFDLSIKAAAWDWRARSAGSLGGSASWETDITMFVNDVPAATERSSDIMNALAETYLTGGGGISFVSPQTNNTPDPAAPTASPPADRPPD